MIPLFFFFFPQLGDVVIPPIAGPYRIDEAQVFTPGFRAAEIRTPGAQQVQIRTPGAQAGQAR